MNTKKNITVGILAHVDAGKTTLSEAMLYLSGKIKKQGRVDHRDSLLDNFELERQRGITIFSKQAVMDCGDTALYLLDTPGHVDFSAETERTLSVLDCAVMVVSGTDGVQAHTETLWRLLAKYAVPCFIFVSKMDLPGTDAQALMENLTARLGDGCVRFDYEGDFYERAAMCSDALTESYLENGSLFDGELAAAIARREIFPCFFGSGLKNEGVETLMEALDRFTAAPETGGEFAARIYKIGRDAKGERLSYLKILGGALKVKSAVSYSDREGKAHSEKINQIRLYSGARFETVDEALPGTVCAVTGLSASYPGQGLGAAGDAAELVSEPVMSYSVTLPKGVDAATATKKLTVLAEEDPQLHISAAGGHISVSLMGRVQGEVFKATVKERCGMDIELSSARVVYRETILDKVEGVGHFEPLRHYAEVHLLLEPMPRGSGVLIDSVCSEDELDRNWQRLILSHIGEKQHLGVLTGSPITDIKITLSRGRAHLKHTEGGDFREATYRAVRQGLMQAKSQLLEPYYAFSIEVPTELIGRAISDLRAMNGSFGAHESRGEQSVITGQAPVAAMNGYMTELASYSRGRGRMSLRPCGYYPCKNAAAVIEEIGYDAQSDTENTPDSVFCAHGAGFTVSWDKVSDYMHLESSLKSGSAAAEVAAHRIYSIDERELEAIMEREFGPIRRARYGKAINEAAEPKAAPRAKKEYVIVDGYNVIFAWEQLKALASDNLDLARNALINMLSGYASFTGRETVLVFDAYRTPGASHSRSERAKLSVAYTSDGETADAYIERLVDEIGKNYAVRVVSGDSLIQLSALRSGVLRTSSREFEAEVRDRLKSIDEIIRKTNEKAHSTKLRDGARIDGE